MKKKLIIALLLALCSTLIYSQNHPLPLNIQKAYDNGFRSMDGYPGAAYWQNSSSYVMDVEVDIEKEQIKGTSTITYSNNSPDTLNRIILRLYQDFFRKGNARQWPIPEGDITSGMQISELEIDGENYDPDNDFPRWLITNFIVRLKKKINPGNTATIKFKWKFDIPTKQGLRMGKYDEGHYFIAYWYPQIAVYDDIDGWDMIDYTGMVEFYNDFNDYNVKLTLPGDYAVWATGELQNSVSIFQKSIVENIDQAMASDEVIHIIKQEDYKNKAVFLDNKKHTWEFIARGVPDFSFAISTHSNWDGVGLEVDPSSKRRIFVNAVYPEGSKHWNKGAEVSRASIAYMCKTLPGVPFPYPHMTSVWNNRRGGGMETPMMANDGAPSRYNDFIELLFHEIAHTYFPFYMGTNERKYSWMDEGWAAYLPNELVKELFEGSEYLKETSDGYRILAGQEVELPLMVPSFHHNNYSSARVASYTRPAMAYHYLRDALGDPLFKKALHEFMNRWNGKHPIPYDFFNTFNDVAGEDLDWFWQPWFFQSGYPDLGIKSFSETNVVTIEKTGTHPIPIQLVYTTEDNESEQIYYSTSVWKNGNDEFKIQLPIVAKVKHIKLVNDVIPDVNPSNDSWPE